MNLIYNLTTKISPTLNLLRISYKTCYAGLIGKLTYLGFSIPKSLDFDQIPLDTDISIMSPELVLACSVDVPIPENPLYVGLAGIKLIASAFFWGVWEFLLRVPLFVYNVGYGMFSFTQTLILATPFGLLYVSTIAIFIIGAIWTKGEIFRLFYVSFVRSLNAFVGFFGFLASQILQKNIEFYKWLGASAWNYLKVKMPIVSKLLLFVWKSLVKIWSLLVTGFTFFQEVKNIMVYVFFGNRNFQDGEQAMSFLNRLGEIRVIYKGLQGNLSSSADEKIFNRFREQMYLISGDVNPLLYPELNGLNLTKQEKIEFMKLSDGDKIQTLFNDMRKLKTNLQNLSQEKLHLLNENKNLNLVISAQFGPGYLDSSIRQQKTIFQRLVDRTLMEKESNPFTLTSVDSNVKIDRAMMFISEAQKEIAESFNQIEANLGVYVQLVKRFDDLPESLKRFELERQENSYQFWKIFQTYSNHVHSQINSLPTDTLEDVEIFYRKTIHFRNEIEMASRSILFANRNLEECSEELERVKDFTDVGAKNHALNEIVSKMTSPFDTYVLYSGSSPETLLNQLITQKQVKLGHRFDEWSPSLFRATPQLSEAGSSSTSLPFSAQTSSFSRPSGKFVELDESARWVVPSNYPDLVEYVGSLPFLRFALSIIKSM